MIGKWTGPDGIEREMKLHPMNSKRIIVLTGFDVEILTGLISDKMTTLHEKNKHQKTDEMRTLWVLSGKILEGHFDFGIDLQELDEGLHEL